MHRSKRAASRIRIPASGYFFLALVALAQIIPHEPRGAQRRTTAAPDGVCYPVNGTGYVVNRAAGLRVPVGTLSPLVEGDSLIVESGTITFCDFRTGQHLVYGTGTRLTVPPVRRPKPPPWWKLLEDHVIRSLSDPESRQMGGSVRGGGPVFWPQDARIAPDVAVVFQWEGLRLEPAALRIEAASDTILVPLTSATAVGHRWVPARPVAPGSVSWCLLDAAGNLLGGGEFEVLSLEAAAAERERFLVAAATVGGASPGLAAVVLAKADHAYLW